jgi:patatin-like phospholipase/acyl hydrolase
MPTYKIIEIALDPKDSLIEKSGITVTFSLHNIEADVAYLNKALKEIEGKLGIESATMANVERTHPHIAAMTPEDLVAAFLYKQSSGFVTIAKEKIAEINKQINDYKMETEEIKAQTGITEDTQPVSEVAPETVTETAPAEVAPETETASTEPEAPVVAE